MYCYVSGENCERRKCHKCIKANIKIKEATDTYVHNTFNMVIPIIYRTNSAVKAINLLNPFNEIASIKNGVMTRNTVDAEI